jgi:hypothetical protein
MIIKVSITAILKVNALKVLYNRNINIKLNKIIKEPITCSKITGSTLPFTILRI